MQEADELKNGQNVIDSYIARWKIWPEVKRMLMSDATLQEVARVIQTSEPEARERKKEALMRTLSRIRAHLRKTEGQVRLAELQSKVEELRSKDKETGKTSGYIDVLESLGELWTIQMARIRMGRSLEEKVKYLITKITQDIGEAREILKFMFEVQQDLGLAKRKPLELQGKFAVLTFDQRQKVAGLLDMVRKKVAEKQAMAEVVGEAAQEVVEEAVLTEQNGVGDEEEPAVQVINVEPVVVDKLVDPEHETVSEKPWKE